MRSPLSSTPSATSAHDKESLYGDWLPFVFTVSLDGASVRAGGRQAAPGVYDLGQSVTLDPNVLRDELNYPDIDESYTEPVTVEYPLRLKHLAFGRSAAACRWICPHRMPRSILAVRSPVPIAWTGGFWPSPTTRQAALSHG